MYIKPLPLSPVLYIYTNQWQMYNHFQILCCSLIYSCIEREKNKERQKEGKEGKKKEGRKERNSKHINIKTQNPHLWVFSVLLFQVEHAVSAEQHVPRSQAVFWWSRTCDLHCRIGPHCMSGNTGCLPNEYFTLPVVMRNDDCITIFICTTFQIVPCTLRKEKLWGNFFFF